MTEEKPEPAADEAEPKKRFITVRGNQVEIGASTPAQLAMLNLTASRMARLDPNKTSNQEALRTYEKVIQIVTSIMVDRTDRDWIEDLLITKEMSLEEATEVLAQATAEWGKEGNREQRRARASRKKAPAGKK
jgi:hypothetical protein